MVVVVVGFGFGAGSGAGVVVGFVVLAGSPVGGFDDFGRTSTLTRGGVRVIVGALSRDSALAFDRNRANPTGARIRRRRLRLRLNRLADFDADDSEDVDAIFSTDALFLGVDAMDTSPKISSNPSIKLSSSSAVVVCSRVVVASVRRRRRPPGDVGLDPLTLLDALNKSNKSFPSLPTARRARHSLRRRPARAQTEASHEIVLLVAVAPARFRDLDALADALANASRSPNEDDDALDASGPPARASTRDVPEEGFQIVPTRPRRLRRLHLRSRRPRRDLRLLRGRLSPPTGGRPRRDVRCRRRRRARVHEIDAPGQ